MAHARSAWGAVAAREAAVPAALVKIREVRLDGLVVLKIIKHCQENFPESVAGSLLGLDVDDVLEVTHSFPLPRDDAADDGDYELKMLGALRAVNIDNNAVGWYQSSYLGSYCTKDTITHQLQYQETLPKSVMLIYDGVKTSQGTLSIKALRLTDAFCDAYRGKRVPAEALATLPASAIFEELPVKIQNSHLIKAFLVDATVRKSLTAASTIAATPAGAAGAAGKTATGASAGEAGAAAGSAAPAAGAAAAASASAEEGDISFARLDLNSGPYLEKHLEILSDATDALLRAHSESTGLARRLEAQRRQREEWIAKRREENEVRAGKGEDLLPLEDPSLPFFRPLPAGSKDPLDVLLMSSQISNYCAQMTKFAGAGFGKLFLAGSLHK